jgi:uncharacterized repeat protein (TIGR03803 family)
MARLRLLKKMCIILVVCTATSIATCAQTFTTLYSFDSTDGSYPHDGLIQATDGNLYGTTSYGGAHTPCNSDSRGCGTVFKITPAGTLTTLYNFCAQTNCADGASPGGGLIQGTDGNFYGTTGGGGTNGYGNGTVFKITAGGTLTTLYNFCAQTNCTDGASPLAGLVQGTDGNFYGTTWDGGASTNCYSFGCGTVFKMTPAGTLTTLHSFDGTDGAILPGGLIRGADGNFYGITRGGGTSTNCNLFGGCGTVFKITPAGALTMLHSFDGTDGFMPSGGLIRGADGNFYGTTYAGGVYDSGTVFQITPAGKLATLYNFCAQASCPDPSHPSAGLIQATDGNFYGTTVSGGAHKFGTVFRLAGAPAARLSATSLSFGDQTLNQASAPKTVTLKNSGTALPVLSGVAIEGSGFAISGNTCESLAISKTCVVSVTFTPQSPGKLTGTLSFTDNASDSPQVVALSGTGLYPTSTTLTSSLNPSTYGQTIIFFAVVANGGSIPPTGTVAFMWKYFTQTYTIGTATLNSAGAATLTKSNLNADPYPMIAVYRGDTNNLSSTSTVLNQTVLQTTSKATLTSTPNPSTVGQAVTLTAKITSPTVTAMGPVTFTLGQTTLGTAQLSGGKATFTTSSLPAGSNAIKLTYNGNSNIARSSAVVTQVVQP